MTKTLRLVLTCPSPWATIPSSIQNVIVRSKIENGLLFFRPVIKKPKIEKMPIRKAVSGLQGFPIISLTSKPNNILRCTVLIQVQELYIERIVGQIKLAGWTPEKPFLVLEAAQRGWYCATHAIVEPKVPSMGIRVDLS